jgi:aryl sulfotransferase
MQIRAVTRIVRNWHADSRAWDGFAPRAGDIMVVTPLKCGTTSMQRIIGMLLRQSTAPHAIMMDQPWIDARWVPHEIVLPMLAATPGRRSLKSHLPLDALPFDDSVLYIHVARDPRDACMSYHHHARACTDAILANLDGYGIEDPTIGAPYPRTPADPRSFFRRWLGDPAFAPLDDHGCAELFELENSFWSERLRPNMLMVHYNDMKADLAGEMQRIATFCGIETPAPLFAEMVAAADFAAMKRDGDALLGHLQESFNGGAQTFLNKGTNGRWFGVLTDADVDDYAAAADAAMSRPPPMPRCRGRRRCRDVAVTAKLG